MDKAAKRTGWCILGAMAAGCVLMAAVEILWQPGYAVKSVCKAALFTGLPLLVRLARGPLLPKRRPGHLWPGAVLAAAVYAAILGGYFALAPWLDLSAVTGRLEATMGVNGANFLPVALYISFANSLLEEFFFRGFGFLALRRFWPGRAGAVCGALLFSAYHMAIMDGWFSPALLVLILLALAAAGLLFEWLDSASDSVLPGWLVHLAANLAINTIGCILFGII